MNEIHTTSFVDSDDELDNEELVNARPWFKKMSLAIIAKWNSEFGHDETSSLGIQSHWLIMDIIDVRDFYRDHDEVLDSIEFYRPLMEWVDSHIADSEASVDFSIRLEYFNTSSSKCLMDLLKRIEKSPIEATILWYYEEEDEDMLEAGEDYSAIVNIPFKLIAVAGP